ncbi:SDR family oxidoreductase [Rhodospirillaceae bacterium SYSU D60014]|uniref:SDR family oxidoreductase n=1 Tax=Virgifigura deserti TaxID=2268457 RepID=UPI000E65FC4D
MRLKPLREQVIVITGATSGIGLATARMASDCGARLVIAARNEEALQAVVAEIQNKGGEAVSVIADVGREADVNRIKDEAIRRFGGFDTWINNAAVSIYGRLDEVSIEDMQRLFDTNFWGQVYGSRAALSHFRDRGTPAKLINMGSVLGERAIPIQGIYSASKHAVAGFTESFRMEIDAAGLPVSVTLIKPSAIDTPYKDHAKNYLDEAPKNPPPVYDVRVVARAILYACEHDRRDITVGGAGRLINLASSMAPRMSDRVMTRIMPYLQQSRDPAGPRDHNNLYAPQDDLEERSNYPFALKSSLYTQASLHPLAAVGMAAVAVALAAGVIRARQKL